MEVIQEDFLYPPTLAVNAMTDAVGAFMTVHRALQQNSADSDGGSSAVHEDVHPDINITTTSVAGAAEYARANECVQLFIKDHRELTTRCNEKGAALVLAKKRLHEAKTTTTAGLSEDLTASNVEWLTKKCKSDAVAYKTALKRCLTGAFPVQWKRADGNKDTFLRHMQSIIKVVVRWTVHNVDMHAAGKSMGQYSKLAGWIEDDDTLSFFAKIASGLPKLRRPAGKDVNKDEDAVTAADEITEYEAISQHPRSASGYYASIQQQQQQQHQQVRIPFGVRERTLTQLTMFPAVATSSERPAAAGASAAAADTGNAVRDEMMADMIHGRFKSAVASVPSIRPRSSANVLVGPNAAVAGLSDRLLYKSIILDRELQQLNFFQRDRSDSVVAAEESDGEDMDELRARTLERHAEQTPPLGSGGHGKQQQLDGGSVSLF